MAVVEIWADFNAQDEDGCIRLNTIGSLKSLKGLQVMEKDRVFISDGEVGAVAELETRKDWDGKDIWVARLINTPFSLELEGEEP